MQVGTPFCISQILPNVQCQVVQSPGPDAGMQNVAHASPEAQTPAGEHAEYVIQVPPTQ